MGLDTVSYNCSPLLIDVLPELLNRRGIDFEVLRHYGAGEFRAAAKRGNASVAVSVAPGKLPRYDPNDKVWSHVHLIVIWPFWRAILRFPPKQSLVLRMEIESIFNASHETLRCYLYGSVGLNNPDNP